MEKLGEREEGDIVYKVARVIEDLAVKYRARVALVICTRIRIRSSIGFLTIG